ncbi:MAG TPA: hypothetical protein ENI34_07245 [candidate division WOR-3 bacterium]|uniref:WD40 repeat domain-containing protein n=1 Tax=candidate division WOR-3 bacterium TaxID=2052148 RepID=A0A9C9EP41_UNCW3|nr:hypothetical protein [candidate division WOR-3 bacterium]
MKQVFLAIIIALMTVGLYGQEPGAVQNEPKVRLKVVYEKTFDEEILDVIFDTATVSIEEAEQMGWKEEAFTEEEKAKGKVLVSYPKVVLISDASKMSYDVSEYPRCRRELRFYRKNGELIKKELIQPRRERVIYSENMRYILRSWVFDEDEAEKEGGVLYKSNGEVVWEKNKNELIAVSREGYVIATDAVFGPESASWYIFYDPLGQEIIRLENPFKDKAEGYNAVKFSSSGNYVVLGSSDFRKTAVILTTKKGKILWQREFSWVSWVPNAADIADNLGIIGTFGIKDVHAFFLNWQGELQWKVRLGIAGNYDIKWSEDQKKAFVISTRGYLWCIDVNDGNFLWFHKEKWATDPSFREKRLSWEIPQFSELNVINDFVYIIGKKGRNWHSSTLFIFDSETGNLLRKIEYPQEKITFVKIDKEIGLINITKRKISILKVEVLK